jgi:hypothetical protein
MSIEEKNEPTDSLENNNSYIVIILFVLSLILFIASIYLGSAPLAILFVLFLVFSILAKISNSGVYSFLLKKSSKVISYVIGSVFLATVPFIVIYNNKIEEYFSDTITLFVITVMFSGYVLYFVLNYFIPIKDMSNDLSRLPELNFKTINNFDTEFDYTRDVLERINNQIKSEIKSLEKEVEGLGKQEKFGLLSSSEVKKIELEAGDVWVMSGDLEADSTDTHIKENVVRKLSNGGKYWYIAPSIGDVKNNRDDMIRFWEGHIELKDVVINKQVNFILLPEAEWFQAHDVVIYHKTADTKNHIIEFIDLEDDSDIIYHELNWKENKDLIQAVATQIRKSRDNKKKSKEGGK